MGTNHARVLASLPGVDLVSIVDRFERTGRAIRCAELPDLCDSRGDAGCRSTR